MICASMNRFRFIVSSIVAGGLAVMLEDFPGARPTPPAVRPLLYISGVIGRSLG